MINATQLNSDATKNLAFIGCYTRQATSWFILWWGNLDGYPISFIFKFPHAPTKSTDKLNLFSWLASEHPSHRCWHQGSDELSWGSNGHHIKQLEFIGQEVTISTSPLSASASARIWGRLGLMTSKTHETKEEANEGKSHHRSVWSMLVQHSAAWEKNWSKVQGSCIDKCNDNSFPPMISKLMLQFASSAKTVCWWS